MEELYFWLGRKAIQFSDWCYLQASLQNYNHVLKKSRRFNFIKFNFFKKDEIKERGVVNIIHIRPFRADKSK